jgi:uncharacterized protein (UPF0335 family)
MQAKDAIAKLVKILTEIDSLNEDVKAIKDEMKESGLNVPVLTTVSKAIVSNKVDELGTKSTETLEAIELSRS